MEEGLIMRFLLIILIFLHGLIHLAGFLKSFGFINLEEISHDISKPIGVLWLISTLLFFATGILYLLGKDSWIIPATLAIVISQLLIILTWQDAKFGTIPNVIILLSIIIGFFVWSFNHQVSQEIKSIKEENFTKEIITAQELNSLPPQVKQWLQNIGLVGKEKIHTVYFKQKGTMKLKPDQDKWSDALAEQYITTDKPAFIWKVKMEMSPFVKVAGRDYFVDGEGKMLMKVASLIPVVNVSHNTKVNQSTLQRFLLELPWYPSMALSPFITWEEVNEHSARATMTYKGTSGSAVFHFDNNGDLLKVSAYRYKENGDNAELIECVGEVKENTVIEGIKIPTNLHVSWVLDEGLFTWYRLEIYDVNFN